MNDSKKYLILYFNMQCGTCVHYHPCVILYFNKYNANKMMSGDRKMNYLKNAYFELVS